MSLVHRPTGVDTHEEMWTTPKKGGGECGSVSQMTFLLALASGLIYYISSIRVLDCRAR